MSNKPDGILGEIVLSPFDYGVIIDIYNDEYQVAHEDGTDIYYKFNDLQKVEYKDKKELLKNKEFKKHYKSIIKMLESRI